MADVPRPKRHCRDRPPPELSVQELKDLWLFCADVNSVFDKQHLRKMEKLVKVVKHYMKIQYKAAFPAYLLSVLHGAKPQGFLTLILLPGWAALSLGWSVMRCMPSPAAGKFCVSPDTRLF